MLAYTDVGLGTPLVLIHGLGSRKEAWASQHPLSERYRLITLDLRGHGETELSTDITMENFAKDIIELLDYLEIDRAYICGLSLGGIIAQELHRQAPERILGLILANTTSYINSFFVATTLYEAKKYFRNETFINTIATRGLHDQSYIEQAKAAFLIRDCYMEAARAPVDYNYFPFLSLMNVPILLIGGDNDQITPVLNQYMMKFYSKRAKFEIIKQCGHLSNIEKSEEFNNIITDFIGGGVGCLV